jgi:hypothetical protein
MLCESALRKDHCKLDTLNISGCSVTDHIVYPTYEIHYKMNIVCLKNRGRLYKKVIKVNYN